MKQVKIHDKEFKLFISHEKIQSVIEAMAEKMNRELDGKDPLFLCILNGSFMFAAELFKRIDFVEAEIYERSELLCGNRIHGPAIIEEPFHTTVVMMGQSIEVDRIGNLLIRTGGVSNG